MNLAETEVSGTLTPAVRKPAAIGAPWRSETTGLIASALSKAQAEIQNASKDKVNPHFKSTYADLASVWDACREPLAKNQLAVTQPFIIDPQGRILLITELLHSSGEWISSVIPVMPERNTPQGVGSAITYMRRFALSALVGVAPAEKPTVDDVDDDDDGNAASGRPNNFAPPQGHPAASSGHQAPAAQAQKVQPQGNAQKTEDRKPSEAQLKRLFAISGKSNTSNEQVKAYIFNQWGRTSSKDLSLSEYDQLCDLISAEGLPPIQNQAPAAPIEEKSSVVEEKPTQWFKNRTTDERMVK